MGSTREPTTLVVVVGTTRAWELTWESFAANVLDELGADLALCVGDRDQGRNPFYERARYIWSAAEPEDWAEAYDRAVGDSSWRVLLREGDHLLGGVRDTAHPQPGAGALTIYMRHFLKESLERSGLTRAYDWLVLTRSDFLWPLAHPQPRDLSERCIYGFDGEQWGGICGRHLVVHRGLAGRLLGLYDPVFTDSERLRHRLDRRSASMDWKLMNLERFQAARLKDLGLWHRFRFLPYVPFVVRARDGPTSWKLGVFDDRLGLYVKYPTERERSVITQRYIREAGSWTRYLAPIRGAVARRRLRRAYRERGLHERPFPLRQAHRRAYRLARWEISRRADRLSRWRRSKLPEQRLKAETRIGRSLRRVPGMPALLDARIRRIRRRTMGPPRA
jgi:hypothetical protein